MVDQSRWEGLWAHDQLSQEMGADRVLYGFSEVPLRYAPTYKYARQAVAPRRIARGIQKARRYTTGGPSPSPLKGFSPLKKAFGAEAAAGASTAAPTPEQLPASPPAAVATPAAAAAALSIATPAAAPADAAVAVEAAGGRRPYDDEKNRVPSWCDRVLWRSLPAPWPSRTALVGCSAGAVDDAAAAFASSDHAPVYSVLELELPLLPPPILHHCTLYISKLQLYRQRAPPSGAGRRDSEIEPAQNLTARTKVGKGVPLPVAGNKLQNLPPQLTVFAHMLALHRLLPEPPQLSAALTAAGAAATNIVIGPMLAQREFLQTQHLHLRAVSLAGSKPHVVGHAAVSLAPAAHGAPLEFDAVVERHGVPAGFNLRGSVLIVYTKDLPEGLSREPSSSRLGDRRPSLGRANSGPGRLSASASHRKSKAPAGVPGLPLVAAGVRSATPPDAVVEGEEALWA